MSVMRIGDQVYPERLHLAKTSLATMSKPEREVHEKSAELLGQVFFAPILAKMRESPFKTDISSGGRGGDAYGQMMDALMVKQVVSPTGQLVQRFAGDMIRLVKRRERGAEELGLNPDGTAKAAGNKPLQESVGKESNHVDSIG